MGLVPDVQESGGQAMIHGAKPRECYIYETVRCPTCRGIKGDERCPRCKGYGTVRVWRKQLKEKGRPRFS